MTDAYFQFGEDIPIDPIRPGTSLLVAGPAHDGARELALGLLAGANDDGAVVVTTNEGAPRLIENFEAIGAQFEDTRTGIVDCVSDDVTEPFPARVLTVSTPQDLTGIGMRYSKLYQEFQHEGVDRVRSGVFSVTTLVSLGDIHQVSRFIHTLVGRISAVNGLGVFLIDPTTQDDRVVNTIGQFCDARIDVRDEGAGPECRTRGLTNHSREWESLAPLFE